MESPSMAVLGSTGLIGRSLIHGASERNYQVTAHSRDPKKAALVFDRYGIHHARLSGYENFLTTPYDLIVNATGVGSPREIIKDPTKVFRVTEEVDRLILAYLEKHPNCRVFNLSSGSVFGLSAGQPITPTTKASIDLSTLRPGDFYSLAKLYSEAKHRAASDKHIVDLRVFAFVSRFLDMEESFFIAEVAKCLKRQEIFKTKPDDMVRDYATAEDIWDVIMFLFGRPAQNAVFDLRSQAPVGKFELLEHLAEKFDLQYEKQQLENVSPTGEKSAYYSRSNELHDLGYAPKHTAMQNIVAELEAMVK